MKKIVKRGLSILICFTLLAVTGLAGAANAWADSVAKIDDSPEMYAVKGIGGMSDVVVEENENEVSEKELMHLIDHVGADLDSADTPEGFYKVVQKNMLKRDTAFQVRYYGSYNDVANAKTILQKIGEIDSKSTSNDADYLRGSVLRFGFNASYTSQEALFSISVTYVESASEMKKVDTKVKSILKDLNIDQYSTVGKIKAIHDEVIRIVSYDQTYADHSGYGGLVAKKHTTVCQGYALLMYKMLTEAGVPCHYVSGDAGERHAWNIVKIGKKWYYLDATWDDPIYTKPIVTYNYFLVGSKTLNKDHKADSEYTKKYTISTSDYDWKTALAKDKKAKSKGIAKEQTKAEKTAANKATKKEKYAAEFVTELRNGLDYDNVEEVERVVYDFYLNLYSMTIKSLGDKAFDALYSDDEDLSDTLVETLDAYANEYIFDPINEYLDSEEAVNDAIEVMYECYTEDELAEMGDEEMEEIITYYFTEVVRETLEELSGDYTKDIIAAVVDEINATM